MCFTFSTEALLLILLKLLPELFLLVVLALLDLSSSQLRQRFGAEAEDADIIMNLDFSFFVA